MTKQCKENSSYIKISLLLSLGFFVSMGIASVFAADDVATQMAATQGPTSTLVPPPANPVTETVTPPPTRQEALAKAETNLNAVENQLRENVGFTNTPPYGGGLQAISPLLAPPQTAPTYAPAVLPNETVSTTAATTAGVAAVAPNATFTTGSAVTLNNSNTFGTPQDPAFQNMIKKMYPMSPSQIESLRDTDLVTQRAIASGATIGTPTPTLSSQTVSLSPGSTPPVIRLSTGYVSSVVFVDETGAPWPVGAYSIGDPQSFNIQWDTKSNLLLIQGQKPFASGNMAVRLVDMATPVMLTLVTDQQNVDYRIDFRVQGRGPNAQASIIGSSLPQNADAILMNLLEGIPPQGSQPLHIIGGPAQGWLQGNTIYLRTPLTILSPAWIKTMTSADGTRVYQFNSTPMILASQGGQPLTLRIEGL